VPETLPTTTQTNVAVLFIDLATLTYHPFAEDAMILKIAIYEYLFTV